MAQKEKLTRYKYRGPRSGVTLRLSDGTEREVQFIPGSELELPADHPYVRKLALKKHLTEVVPAATSPATPPASKVDKVKATVTVKEEVNNAG